MPRRASSIKNSSEPFALSSVKRSSRLSDKVTEQLSEAILSGQFQPGSRLPSERELGDQLQVSRTVIREAVRSLAAHGLVMVTSGRGVEVSREPHRGAVKSMRLMVRGYGEIDYTTVHQVRVPLEIQAAALTADRASDEGVERLRGICEVHAAQLEGGDMVGASRSDLAFHDAIAELSGNPLLLAMYHSLAEVLKDVRTPAVHSLEVADSGLRAHRWLLECITAGDVDAARGAMARHLSEAERIWRGEKPD